MHFHLVRNSRSAVFCDEVLSSDRSVAYSNFCDFEVPALSARSRGLHSQDLGLQDRHRVALRIPPALPRGLREPGTEIV